MRFPFHCKALLSLSAPQALQWKITFIHSWRSRQGWQLQNPEEHHGMTWTRAGHCFYGNVMVKQRTQVRTGILVYPLSSLHHCCLIDQCCRKTRCYRKSQGSFPLRSNSGNGKIMEQLIWFTNKHWVLYWWKVTGVLCLLFLNLEMKPH